MLELKHFSVDGDDTFSVAIWSTTDETLSDAIDRIIDALIDKQDEERVDDRMKYSAPKITEFLKSL